MVSKIKDYEFQEQCVDYLIDKTIETNSKQVITVKAPTGAGKTVILIKYVDKFLKNTAKPAAARCRPAGFLRPGQRLIVRQRASVATGRE